MSNIQIRNYIEDSITDIDNFDQYCQTKGSGYIMPSFPHITDSLEGLEAGMYLIASESNHGKSALLMNMMFDLCNEESNNLFGIYYSLDDSMMEIIPRIIAMDQRIPIAAAAKPRRYQDAIEELTQQSIQYQDWLEKRDLGLQRLKDMSRRFKIEDSNRIRSREDIEKHMEMVLSFIRTEINSEMNIVVAIDSINDIRFENKFFKSSTEKHNEVAKVVKDWATGFNIPIFASSHLRKLNANRRPNIDDLKESGEYAYEASLVWMVHNDLSKNGYGAKIYYVDEDDPYDERKPIIEINWAKNKKSSYKGHSFCFFVPNQSKVIECPSDLMDIYKTRIFEL